MPPPRVDPIREIRDRSFAEAICSLEIPSLTMTYYTRRFENGGPIFYNFKFILPAENRVVIVANADEERFLRYDFFFDERISRRAFL
jgi:hypothetical protein